MAAREESAPKFMQCGVAQTDVFSVRNRSRPNWLSRSDLVLRSEGAGLVVKMNGIMVEEMYSLGVWCTACTLFLVMLLMHRLSRGHADPRLCHTCRGN
jgi:hypothetical protein